MEYVANVTFPLRLSKSDIRSDPSYYEGFFKDIRKPTKQELRKYFEIILRGYEGKDLLGNVKMAISKAF